MEYDNNNIKSNNNDDGYSDNDDDDDNGDNNSDDKDTNDTTTISARSPTMVTLHDTRFVECRWWNGGWTVKTVSLSLSLCSKSFLNHVRYVLTKML